MDKMDKMEAVDHEVESIIGCRWMDEAASNAACGSWQYLIRWVGYGSEADTWTDETDITNGLRGLVRDFKAAMKAQGLNLKRDGSGLLLDKYTAAVRTKTRQTAPKRPPKPRKRPTRPPKCASNPKRPKTQASGNSPEGTANAAVGGGVTMVVRGDDMNLLQLRGECKRNGLRVKGSKAELLARLRTTLAAAATSPTAATTGADVDEMLVRVGATVEAVGLVTDLHLNGCRGVVVEDTDPQTDRVVVLFHGRTKRWRIKLQNLVFTAETSTCGEMGLLQLRNACRDRGLRIKGTKVELLARLRSTLATGSPPAQPPHPKPNTITPAPSTKVASNTKPPRQEPKTTTPNTKKAAVGLAQDAHPISPTVTTGAAAVVEWEEMNVLQLRDECEERGLGVKGSRSELLTRLRSRDALPGIAVAPRPNPKAEKSKKDATVHGLPDEEWTSPQLEKLSHTWTTVSPTNSMFWERVACHVPGKTGDDCRTRMQSAHPTPNRNKASGRSSTAVQKFGKLARKGTVKRKQQMRAVLQRADDGYEDDVFDVVPMKAAFLRGDVDTLVDEIHLARIFDPAQKPSGKEEAGRGTKRQNVSRQKWGSDGSDSKGPTANAVFSPSALRRPDQQQLDKYIHRARKANVAKCGVGKGARPQGLGGKGRKVAPTVKFLAELQAQSDDSSDDDEATGDEDS